MKRNMLALTIAALLSLSSVAHADHRDDGSSRPQSRYQDREHSHHRGRHHYRDDDRAGDRWDRRAVIVVNPGWFYLPRVVSRPRVTVYGYDGWYEGRRHQQNAYCDD